MNSPTVTVTVKLFAAYQEAFGTSELQFQFPTGTLVEAVRDRLIAEKPQLAEWKNLTRFGVNLQFVGPETPLQDGDEVVLIPPVSGGRQRKWRQGISAPVRSWADRRCCNL